MKYMTAIGIRVDDLLNDRDTSNEELATAVGVAKSTVQKIVRGKAKSVSLNTLIAFCKVFDITLQEFFNTPIFSVMLEN